VQMYSNHDESVGERICFGVLYYDSDVIVDKTRLGWADRTLGFGGGFITCGCSRRLHRAILIG
jgi:hypothetical protein